MIIDKIEGKAKQVKGAVKEALGEAIDDTSLKAKGKADKAECKAQEKVGDVKDRLSKS